VNGSCNGIYLRDLLHGNLGWSISHSHPVSQMIVQRVPWTLGMMLSSLVLASLFGTAIGVAASWYQDRPAERLTISVAALLSAIPEFLIAILLLLIFSIGLNWLPRGGGRTVFQSTGGGFGGALVIDLSGPG
jgi:ABC-type dipeptide/oligopeptide/nickel transport system permease component